MARWIGGKCRPISLRTPYPWRPRTFRSNAALEAIATAAEEKVRTVALYNYPSFSGAISALFAHLYHSRLNLPCLILPSSSVEPLRVEDFCVEGEGLDTCYLLDFIGPKGFASKLSQQAMCEVIAFDHRKPALTQIDCCGDPRVTFNVNLAKSSSAAVYEYFSNKLVSMMFPDVGAANLLNSEDQVRLEKVLKYIEDADLRRWSLPEIKAFTIGLSEWRSKLNCITNPYMYEQGVRADGNSDLSDEIGKQLSLKSAKAGLRPIGAVICYNFRRKNLKMCLRSTDTATDTSEVAKAYGGGGCPSSSSFIIRMDEYNQWRS
ncbi:hypothetical protein ES319_D13G053800v1 [Gossypium barbadense]|uniref:Uncharacterized protein n=2 Tax=Gossypium TaxID=3633 RepID=A0A5J5NKD9_GOSBA|nr:hypothetical protein ES319_D13G053800v1 [Gossypium barbadense]TYG36326.1 hypothetical protein ES288_D13G056200v1 [Gossypium darwinii]TYG36327.1 hypothetical protein ES288_D13G056200v1 [Gossypium darwinii]